MALFVLRKLILQARMHSLPVGLDVWLLVSPFIYFHTSCMRTAKSLARLRGCVGSPEPSLVAYVISTIISWAGSSLTILNGCACMFEGLLNTQCWSSSLITCAWLNWPYTNEPIAPPFKFVWVYFTKETVVRKTHMHLFVRGFYLNSLINEYVEWQVVTGHLWSWKRHGWVPVDY